MEIWHNPRCSKSRAALARALVMRRPVLMLDEPFSALGPAMRTEMLDLVRDVIGETGASLVMVTHDPGDAARIADRISVVADGVAAEPAPTRALLDNPSEALRDYLG